MSISRYVDGSEYRAWLVGCDAPGVDKDLADLTTCLEQSLAPGYRARVDRPQAIGAGTVTRAQIDETFAKMARFEGHRIIWFGGHADLRETGVFFKTDGRQSDHIDRAWLYDRLNELAEAGTAPLWAIMDFCHAAPKAREWSHKLILFCAAHGDETARGTESEGGLFTQAILRGLSRAQTNDVGQITVDSLRTWVNEHVSSGRQHPYFLPGHYGTRALNQLTAPRPTTKEDSKRGNPLAPDTQTKIVDALMAAKLVDPSKRSLLFNGLPDTVLWGIETARDALSQVRNDIKFLAEAETDTAQGDPPLAVYLANAVGLTPLPIHKTTLSNLKDQMAWNKTPVDPPPTRKASSERELRKRLCNCFEDVESARNLCRDAGLAMRRISFQGSIENIWAAALREAKLSQKLEKLIALAREDYPEQF